MIIIYTTNIKKLKLNNFSLLIKYRMDKYISFLLGILLVILFRLLYQPPCIVLNKSCKYNY